MSDQQPIRVVVEIATPETVKRLEAENAQLRKELGMAVGRIDSLHRSVYELMGIISDLRKDKKR